MYYDKQTDILYDGEYAMEGFLGKLKDTIATIIEKLIHKIIDLARFISKKKSIEIDDTQFKELKQSCGIKSKNISEFNSVLKKLHSEAQDIKKRIDTEKDESKLSECKEELSTLSKKISLLTKILYSNKSSKDDNEKPQGVKSNGKDDELLTDAFHKALSSGNVRSMRIMMKDALLLDPSFHLFNAMMKEAKGMNGLFDKHDDRELILDKNKWNDDYMNISMVRIVGNFSHERLHNLMAVVQYLRPGKKYTLKGGK